MAFQGFSKWARGGAQTPADLDLAPGDLIRRQAEAQELSARMPALLIEASRIASTIVHGLHGRRRAGPGETFWQFRTYDSNDDATLIDWRRSASSDHVFVREREWEAAHTFWLWADLSPSMMFESHLASVSKRDRALVLVLACVETLVRAGERVGLLALGRPTASRTATSRLAQEIVANAGGPVLSGGLPPATPLGRFTGAVLISDFLSPVEDIADRIRTLSANGVNGHLIQVLDPAEEALPYDGRAEFVGMSGEIRWTAERAETLRDAYQRKIADQKDELAALARSRGWSFATHHTDRSPTEPLLALIQRLQAGEAEAARDGGGAGR